MTSFIQPKGSTTIANSTEVLSQILNISQDTICPLEPGTDLTNFQFGLDPKTKQLFNISGVTGLFNSVSALLENGASIDDGIKYLTPEMYGVVGDDIQSGLNLTLATPRSLIAPAITAQNTFTFAGIGTTAPSDAGGLYKDASGNVKVK